MSEQPDVTTGQEPTVTDQQPAGNTANAEADAQQQANEVNTQEVNTDEAPQKPDTFDRKYVEQLRDEAAGNRKRAKELEESVAAAQTEKEQLINQIGKAFGFVKDEEAETVDAQKLVEQVSTERDSYAKQLNDLKSELALNHAATAHNADTDLLIPYLKGTGALSDLDPAADDYNAQVAAVVQQAVESNPKLATQAVPRSSSVDSTNPNPTRPGGKISPEELSRLAAAGKWDEINEAAATGRIA